MRKKKKNRSNIESMGVKYRGVKISIKKNNMYSNSIQWYLILRTYLLMQFTAKEK